MHRKSSADVIRMCDFKLTGWPNQRPRGPVCEKCAKFYGFYCCEYRYCSSVTVVGFLLYEARKHKACIHRVWTSVSLQQPSRWICSVVVFTHERPLNSAFNFLLLLPVFSDSFHPDFPASCFLLLLPCPISGMSPKMSKPYGGNSGVGRGSINPSSMVNLPPVSTDC